METQKTYFGLTEAELTKLYREALLTDRYVIVREGTFKTSEIMAYKKDYPLGDVVKTSKGVVLVVMPRLGSLDTEKKIKELVAFYMKHEMPQDLQGYISVEMSKKNEVVISYLSKGIDIGLRVYSSKFMIQWRITWENELDARMVTKYHNLPFKQLPDSHENIYYILKTISNYLVQHTEILTKLLEK